MAFRKIVVAVDGSDPSLDASDCAIELAKNSSAELIILFIVFPVPSSDFEYDNVGRGKEIERTETENAKQIVEKVKQKATENKVNAETAVLIQYTSVAKEIVEYAEKNNIDTVVIGNKGKHGFKDC